MIDPIERIATQWLKDGGMVYDTTMTRLLAVARAAAALCDNLPPPLHLIGERLAQLQAALAALGEES